MRLFNFTFVNSTKTTAAIEDTDPSPNLITSGVNGADGIAALRNGGSFFFSSAAVVGDDTDEDPYGNANLYNSSRISNATELAVTQSFSAAMTGSAQTDFIFLLERDHRG